MPEAALVKGQPAPPSIRRQRYLLPAEVLSAAEQAAAILQHADSSALSVREEAHREGWNAGYAEWQSQLSALLDSHRELMRSAEHDLMVLAVAIAEKIIGRELQSNPAIICRIVQEALETAPRNTELTLIVHPSHLPECAAFERMEPVRARVVANASVAPGGCRIESRFGRIEADLQTQLAAILQALQEALR